MRAAQIAADGLGDADRALAALDGALAARADWVPALLLRARVLTSAGRPLDAAHSLAACLAVGGDPAEVAQSHLALEALYRGPLADEARAMSHLNAALAASPENAEALSRLARLHRRARNWPAAADALRRLSAARTLGSLERAAALVDLAEVQVEGFGDPAAARELSGRALELAPDDLSLRARAVRLQDGGAIPSGVVNALQAAASAAPPGPDRARAHLRAARVLLGAFDDDRLAIGELQRALASDPGHTEARAALAEIYAGSDPPLAVEEHRRMLASDPARVASWRALYALFRTANAHDRAFVVAGVLRFLQVSAAALDGAFYAENALHAPSGTSQALTPGEWIALRHPGDGGPLAEVVRLCGGAMAEAAGLHPGKDKLKDAHALAGLLDELCVNMDLGTPALRAADGADVLAEPGSHPSVRVGREVARRRSVGEQRFMLARAAAHLRSGSAFATRVTPAALGELVAAAVRQVVPDYDVTGTPPPALVKAVGRALPRKVRRALDGPARALAGAWPVDVAAWQVAAEATANRAGLLLAVDIPAALSLVARERGVEVANGSAEIASGVRSCAALRHLVLFTISDDHLRLRQRLRLAIA
jgi:tetratricopeptide (TPR) repeat protein